MAGLTCRPRPSKLLALCLIIWICCLVYLGSSIKICSSSECKDEYCKAVECHHGHCDRKGGCVCDPCWNGRNCSIYQNQQPFFAEEAKDIIVELTGFVEANRAVTTVTGKDSDVSPRCDSDTQCACGTLRYSITRNSHKHGRALFRINADSGELFTNELLEPLDYAVEVGVSNPSTGGVPSTVGDTAMVRVKVTSPMDKSAPLKFGDTPGSNLNSLDLAQPQVFGPKTQDDLLNSFGGDNMMSNHHRSKRAVPTSPNTVDNMTLYMEKEGIYENVTELRPGDQACFLLAVHIPAGTHDLLVELFTPDNQTTIMSLCNARISHVGKNIQSSVSADPLKLKPKMEARDGSYNYDRAIINLGNVTNDNGDTSAAQHSKIYIQWCAVMLYTNETVNGSTYWVSGGAEYNNHGEVWVGQASFTLILEENTAFTLPRSPTFNMTGPEAIEISQTLSIKVDMYIPYSYTDIFCDAFAPLNSTDVMSVCNSLVTDTDQNYGCMPVEHINYTNYLGYSGLTHYRSRLHIGRITNAGVREAANTRERERITWHFNLRVSDNTSLVGEQYWVGAACEIGTDQIWAGQLKVNITDKTTTNMTEVPAFSMAVKGGTTRAVGESVRYELNMTIPENTEGTYLVEALAPYNFSAPQMKICNISICFHGINVPCLNDKKAVFSSRYNTSTMDRVVWDLGRLRNTGQRSSALKPDANILRVCIVAQLLNHSLNGVGEKVWLTVGMKFDGQRLWVGQNAIEVAENATSANASQAPAFTLSYPMGTDYIHVGAVTQVHFVMTTQAEVTYHPMDMELILPWQNASAVMSVCRAEVLRSGRNLPCFDCAQQNKSFTYTSKSGNEVYDKALLNMGYVTNTRLASEPAGSAEDDQVTFALTLKVMDHPIAVSNGSKHWVSGGLLYSDTKMWVGQIALYALKDMVAEYTAGQTPYYELVRVGANPADMQVMQGTSVAFRLYMQLPPKSNAYHKITVTSLSDKTHVCQIHVVEVGFNVPCVDQKKRGNETSKHATTQNTETMELDFGVLSNIGSDAVDNSTTFGNNTVVVEVIVHLAPDAVTTGTHDVKVELMSGSVKAVDQTLQLTAITPTINTTTAVPDFSFTIAPLNDTGEPTHHIAKGQSKLFVLEMSLKDYSVNKMLVKFLTPVNDTGVMEVCNVNVLYVGTNVPCLKRELYTATFENRSNSLYNDIGVVDLGYVCHFKVENSTDADKIRIEAVAKVLQNTTMSDGDKVWFSATTRLNDDQIYVSQIGVIIRDQHNETIDQSASVGLAFNLTAGNMKMSPGLVYTLPLDVTVPVNTSMRARVNVTLPVAASAVLTVRDLRVTSAGPNLGCLNLRSQEDYTEVANSTQKTSQNDYALLDLGVVTNSGVTDRLGSMTAVDNQFRVELEVQLADAQVANHGTQHDVSVDLLLGDGVFNVKKTIEVDRTNVEQPELCLTATFNSTITYDDTELIVIDSVLKHKNTSTGEGYNVSTCFYFPMYIEFVSISSINFTAPLIVNASDFTESGVCFQFERLYFTDIVAFTFSLKVSKTQVVPEGGPNANGTTPFEAGCNMIWRANHVNDSGTFFVTRLDSVSFMITSSAVASAAACTPTTLGLDTSFQDCQFTGSVTEDNTKDPKQAKSSGAGFQMADRKGSKFQRHLTVAFGNMTKVTEITVHEVSAIGVKIKDLVVWYSNDGINWVQGETIALPAGYTSQVITLSSPMESREIKLEAKTTHAAQQDEGKVGLKVDMKGCAVSGDVAIEEVCNAHRRRSWEGSVTTVPDFLRRDYLIHNAKAYVCDVNADNKMRKSCYTSPDGNNWKVFDKQLVSILGVETTENALYGVAHDQRAYLRSIDDGETWTSVSKEKYDAAVAGGSWTPATNLKWESAGHGQYPPTASGSWKADYVGVHYGVNKVLDWTTCCP